jgi:hypothetical protein
MAEPRKKKSREVPKERVNNTWGCPHEEKGACTRVNGIPCDPGMKGCVLSGRFTFVDPKKNRPTRP